ncbi:DeoR/GlpR family DNA-binding transcription regulator [Epibacterium ulvae]|uniref:DeoR/GlpR family DNA-binding transcription regulator n=1 Tax=Epibacterium ulvae TaxID=1156985 RepID=UPI00249028FD|nr:DeoR/GlpR family DNA-binding transcription regulator [Epibacterium ulvae]
MTHAHTHDRMAGDARKSTIVEILRADGRVSVDALARQFSVTVHTIRRDLTELADAGHLERVHGGAILAKGTTNIDYVQRQQLNAEGKQHIAKACAQAIPNDACVFINIGTTTEAVARELLGHKGLIVVTNSLNTANILAANPDIDIVVAGGSLRRADGGLLGNLTTQVVDLFKFDYAVISCAAIDADGELLDFDLQEVHATRSIINRARSTFVVVDHSKIMRAAPGRVGTLHDIDALFTDRALPKDLHTRWVAMDVELNITAGET